MTKTSYKENLTIAVDFVYDISANKYVSFREEPVTKGSFCSFTGITKGGAFLRLLLSYLVRGGCCVVALIRETDSYHKS